MQDFRLNRGFGNHQAQFIVFCLGVAVVAAIPLAQDILKDKGYSLVALLLLISILALLLTVAAGLLIAAIGFLLTIPDAARDMSRPKLILASVISIGYIGVVVTVFFFGAKPWLIDPLRRVL